MKDETLTVKDETLTGRTEEQLRAELKNHVQALDDLTGGRRGTQAYARSNSLRQVWNELLRRGLQVAPEEVSPPPGPFQPPEWMTTIDHLRAHIVDLGREIDDSALEIQRLKDAVRASALEIQRLKDALRAIATSHAFSEPCASADALKHFADQALLKSWTRTK